MEKMKSQPNMLLIVADQIRADFIDYTEGETCLTPNIRDLAKRGQNWHYFYTNTPICVPARVALATGMYPANTGAYDNNSFLPLSKPTFYQRLRDHGYWTGIVGKSDLAKPENYLGKKGNRPKAFAMGFTHPCEIEGKIHASNFEKPVGPYGFYLEEKGLYEQFYRVNTEQKRKLGNHIEKDSYISAVPAEDHADMFVANKSCEWIQDRTDIFPWFLQVCFPGPHNPFDPPAEYIEWVRANGVMERLPERDTENPADSENTGGKPGWVKKKALGFGAGRADMDYEKARLHYAAAIRLIDDCVGKLIEVLKMSGGYEGTYVMFTADHGEMAGDKGLFTKQVAYEPSVRIPFICAGPGIAAGDMNGSLGMLMDIHPTALELCGVRPHTDIDARSFAGYLFDPDGQAGAFRDAAVSTIEQFRCLRTLRYKYVHNVNESPELYDMREDPRERNNIAAENKELCGKFFKQLSHELMAQGLNR